MKLNDYFVSNEFLSLLPVIGDKEIDSSDLVSFVINNAIIHNELMDDSPESMKETVLKLIDIYLNNDWLNRTEVAYELFHEDLMKLHNGNEEEVKKHYAMLLSKDKRIYHCTTSAVTDVTRVLDPHKRLTPVEDINEINDIFERHGAKSIFGWGTINSEGRVYYSTTPNAGHYSKHSPEFFHSFLGGSMSIYWGYEDILDRDAYGKRDYEGCKKNIEFMMDKYNLTDEERMKVMEFFERNWKIYSNADPVMICITKPNPDVDKEMECHLDCIDIFGDPTKYYRDEKETEIDGSTTEPIEFRDEDIIKLPSFRRIQEYCHGHDRMREKENDVEFEKNRVEKKDKEFQQKMEHIDENINKHNDSKGR